MISNKRGFFALSPLMLFIVLYLVTSIIAGDFYKVPITVAFMIASIYMLRHHRMYKKSQLITMLLAILVAGTLFFLQMLLKNQQMFLLILY